MSFTRYDPDTGEYIALCMFSAEDFALNQQRIADAAAPALHSSETSLQQGQTSMILNSANLRTLFTGYSSAFHSAFAATKPLYPNVAMTVPSSTRSNEYGWLGDFPRLREWIGDRIVRNIAAHGYTIKNRSFESTVAVPKEDIEDDQVGIYTPMMSELGTLSSTFPDELVWSLLKEGWTTPCYDGQYFFDTDHPRLDAGGTNKVSWANTDGGTGPAWFLADNTRSLKPIIFQNRREFTLARMDQDTDEAVFNRKEYRYGVDGRCNVGYGLPQLIWGSKQPLNEENYVKARTALTTMKGDYDRLLAVKPAVLIVGPSNEAAARRLLLNETTGIVVDNSGPNPVAYSETNPWKGTAELLVVPWLD